MKEMFMALRSMVLCFSRNLEYSITEVILV